jgi:hypothetical protein
LQLVKKIAYECPIDHIVETFFKLLTTYSVNTIFKVF